MPEQNKPFELIPDEHPTETVKRFPEGELKVATLRLLDHARERGDIQEPQHRIERDTAAMPEPERPFSPDEQPVGRETRKTPYAGLHLEKTAGKD